MAQVYYAPPSRKRAREDDAGPSTPRKKGKKGKEPVEVIELD